jgi:hypothetical protein
MKLTDYNYKTSYKLDNYGQRVIVLHQTTVPKGEEKSLEIPEDDLDIIIKKLSNIKSIVDDPIIPYEEQQNNKIQLEPNIVQTLVALFFSGVSIQDLATQYDYPEDLIKNHLESKGIVIFDDFNF